MCEIKLSIITVCYNAEQAIVSTLKSIACQNYSHIEYIVIDGASTDGTLQLVRQYMPNAYIVSEPDRGLYDAMNKGIKVATGHYLWFVNAGDAIRSAATAQEIVSQAEAKRRAEGFLPGVIYGDTMIVDDNQKDLHLRRLRPPKELSSQSFRKGMLVCHQAFLAHRDLVTDYDLRYRFSADFDWCIRVLQQSRCNLFIPSIVANYLKGGLTTKNRMRSLFERFKIMSHHYGVVVTILEHLSFVFYPRR